MWVVGLEVKITTTMSRLPVYFGGQFRTPVHNQNVQEWKGIGTSSIDWAQQIRFYLKTETDSSLRNAVFSKNRQGGFLDEDKTMDNVQIHNICISEMCSIIQETSVDTSQT
jgi:hypothetical protein